MKNNKNLCCSLFGLSFLLAAAGCTTIPQVGPTPQVSTAEGSITTEPEPVSDTVTQPEAAQTVVAVGNSSQKLVDSPRQGDLATNGDQSDPDTGLIGVITEPIAVPRDLWDRLRAGFSLQYSNPNDPVISSFESWYSSHPKYFDRLADRAYWYLPYVIEQVEKRGMPLEVALLPAVESAFRPDAVSRSNAVGMWQFIATTGTRFGLRRDWWMDGRRDMVQSTRAALDYLDFLAKEFDGDWELVLASYNAGEGKIRKEVRRNKAANKSTRYPALNLSKETREYVPKLFAIRNIVIDPEKYNIRLKSIPDRQTLTIVDARTQTDLAVAASLIPISGDQLRILNNGYKRGVTPPSGPHNIVVPTEYAGELLASLGNLSSPERLRWARHEVRKGEYLGRIARKYGIPVDSIIQANQLSSNLIMPGQELKIPLSTRYVSYARASVSDVIVQDGDSVYTVQKGDSLWRISRNNSISLATLLKWNGLSKYDLLFPGQQLIVGKATS
jgi:membrane-bound lytic murein transglycosylase D